MQGLLEVLDVPYAGSDVEASAICMDKLVFKDLLARHGIPQVDYCRAGEEDWRAIASGFGQPVWVKPARLGSSVGHRARFGRAGARPRRRAGGAPRSPRDRGGAGARQGGRVLAARQRGSDRFTARRDRHQGTRLVRLRGQVRRGRDGAGGSRRDLRTGHGTPSRAGAQRVHLCGCSGLARCDFFVDERRGPGQRAQHDPRLHRDQRLRQALRGGRHRVRGPLRPLVELAIERTRRARSYEI